MTVPVRSDGIHGSETALILGGASGIGRATADALGRDGLRVFVADRDGDAAQTVAQGLVRDGATAEALTADVTDAEQVAALFVTLQRRCERLDLMVNSVGALGETAPIEEITDEDWERTLAVNLTGTFYCCREALRWMKRHGRGRIINFASVAALTPTPGALAYSASKAGVIGFSRSLAREAARYDVRVNVIAPGYVQTPMLDRIDASFREQVLRRTPLKRFASPEEIAALVCFLAGPGGDFFTGQVLSPNGGLVMI
jgi:NAD(P)-dependent dehydrogenase (short-subunit alcohol dehydrogenase family)